MGQKRPRHPAFVRLCVQSTWPYRLNIKSGDTASIIHVKPSTMLLGLYYFLRTTTDHITLGLRRFTDTEWSSGKPLNSDDKMTLMMILVRRTYRISDHFCRDQVFCWTPAPVRSVQIRECIRKAESHQSDNHLNINTKAAPTESWARLVGTGSIYVGYLKASKQWRGYVTVYYYQGAWATKCSELENNQVYVLANNDVHVAHLMILQIMPLVLFAVVHTIPWKAVQKVFSHWEKVPQKGTSLSDRKCFFTLLFVLSISYHGGINYSWAHAQHSKKRRWSSSAQDMAFVEFNQEHETPW